MPDPELVALIAALVVLASAVVGFMAKLRDDVSEIHIMVNSHAEKQAKLIEDQGGRIEQLADALRAAGVDVPDNHTTERGES